MHSSGRDATRKVNEAVDTEPVSAYPVRMNVTISIDDELLERARRLARQRGTSLQELIRDQLRLLAGERSGADAGRELLDLMEKHGGHSGGRQVRREDAYAGRV